MLKIIKTATFLFMSINTLALIFYITVRIFKFDKVSIDFMTDVVIFSNIIFWILIYTHMYFDIS